MQTAAIIGVGLIGGSFGLALKAAGFCGRILGVSPPTSARAALERGAIDAAMPLADAVAQADLIYLAQPISHILDSLHYLDAWVRPGALITDAGSTKQAIVSLAHETIRRAQFLGGHPLAGKERRGVGAADAALFSGRTWVLTPQDPAELETPAARDFLGWLERIGAHPKILGAAEHDSIVSYTSHLPQLASTALAATVGAYVTKAEDLQVSGPGLADTTRLALSSYELWRDILDTNSAPVEKALTEYIQELERLRENLRTGRLQDQFERGAALAGNVRRL